MSSKYDFVKDLNPTKEEWRIKVRVVRCWKVPSFNQKDFDDNVDMVLVDERGGRIHATAKGTLQVRKKIHEGDAYFIKNFGVGLNTDSKNARMRRKGIIAQRKNSKKFTSTLNSISRMADLTEINAEDAITMRSTVTVLSKEKFVSGNDNCPSSTSTYVCQQNTNSPDQPVLDISSVNEDYWDVGDPTFICTHCGASMWYEERLKKDRKSCTPEFGLCCGNGKVKLPSLKMAPDTLLQLHNNEDIRSRHFLRYIRTYNMIFAFTSFGAKVDRSVNEGSGPYCFRVGGQVHHLMGSLIPPDNTSPKLKCSPTNNEDILDPDIVRSLKEMLDEHNRIAQSFRYARDRYKEDDFNGVKLRLIRKRGSDGRVYNLPSASEVAALIVGDIDNVMGDRDIIVETQTGLLQRIDVKHPLYLGLQYPLLFPYGEDGYRDDVQRASISSGRTNPRSTISMKEFFSFRLQMRSGESQILLHSRKLFQQFLVDAYTMVEYDRLIFIRHNQNQLRAELYKNIIHASDKGEDAAVKTGKRIILPSSFTGGPRYMAENCKDAFAICRWAGYPHLFITITCNPKWPEITRFLRARNLNAEDRPDILCRVFKFKLDQLLHDLKKEHVLGRVNAYVCTIEFQKRGLPHAHILLFLHPSNKPNSGLDIDRLISAEIPNKETHPSLFLAVTSYMMHGPCGANNYKSPCMKEGKCTKKFPKGFCSRTIIDDDGFPHYKRRDNGRVAKKNGVELDNRFVVPYNAKLLLKYQAHINVEYTCQTSAIKYLFKYIHKGNDRVTAAIHHSDDEIKMFYDCRYVSACEAAWRIFGFEIHYRNPPVMRLPFHLPNEKTVVFHDTASISEVKTREEFRQSIFESWMDAKGCTSYEDLRTINGVMFPTFKDACYSLGLLDDDNEYIDAIKEASSWQSASYLRRLFALLLFGNSMNRPENVWGKCWQFLSDDVLYRHRTTVGHPDANLTEEQIKNTTLAEIDKVIQSNGKCLSDYPSMPCITGASLLDMHNCLVLDELLYDRLFLVEEHKRLMSSLTDEQKVVYDKIISAVSVGTGGFFFLYGFGGTGKTFIWNTLSASIRSKGEIVLNVASSGIASLLLPGGRTTHSRFRIPIQITEDSTCNIRQDSNIAELLAKTKLIIWDEAPMVHRFCFEALDKTLRDVLRFSDSSCVDKPFGGKVVVLRGDFRKILPVVPHGSRQDIVHATINSSCLWSHCHLLTLTKNMWLSSGSDIHNLMEIKEFSDWLLKVGDGVLGDDVDGESIITIPDELLIKKITDPGDERIYLSSDNILKQDGNSSLEDDEFSPEILNTFSCSGLPDHKLILKVKVPVMLLRNIDQSRGLCNGTRLLITRLGNHVVETTVLTRSNIGENVLIPRMTMSSSSHSFPVNFQRRQFPLVVSFAMTINKSQGQSLSHVGIYLPRPVFSHGQLYVALSRVKSKKGLKILIVDDDGCVTNNTFNIVYKEVFQRLL
ncbi:uncharacterized protein LOC133292402 [Gastrolobium bilobum]|uniref:uncharacterized protein LOC133292402 n=1 Tax=Gastrolobium bilobum TaxID=150636 RepID=UPI002AAF8019|nr:uncharacterized protein LOC133292402 [Gastrolobium bilobum]